MNLLKLLVGSRRGRARSKAPGAAGPFRPRVERLEKRDLPAPLLTAADVKALLQRASTANARQDAIIAVVDRMGNILGVRVEAGVSPRITGNATNLVFAIDGAVAEARTGAFFANDQAPLTARTIQFISQTTMTPKEINTNPNLLDPNNPHFGPGFVAPVNMGGHFPPKVNNTPTVDLFAIEYTNRDGTIHPGPNGVKSFDPALILPERFNDNPAFIPPGKHLTPPNSYGFVSGLFPLAQARGIGTLPGGIPLYKDGFNLVGGIGVFFPGKNGFATNENSSLSDNFNPRKPDLSLEAEFQATVAATSGIDGINIPAQFLPQVIALGGITLDVIGPGGQLGLRRLLAFGSTLGTSPGTGSDMPVNTMGDKYLDGVGVPEGWLVIPHDGGGLTAAEVTQIINQGIATANATRAQIRLPNGQRTKMVFAVADKNGDVLGLFRMPDATVFSIDVAVAKARNVVYYNDAAALQRADRVPGLPPGVALTNRTFRYLALPNFPEGPNSNPPGPFSLLLDHGRVGSRFHTVMGFNAFHPETNFRNQTAPLVNQNGIVFFPGSSGVYVNGVLLAGFGVSGDGVDQDDFVTQGGIRGFGPPLNLRADNFFVQRVRLPYDKFPRNPLA
jgi:uncharacterized protein GlcG (DUF336 family)